MEISNLIEREIMVAHISCGLAIVLMFFLVYICIVRVCDCPSIHMVWLLNGNRVIYFTRDHREYEIRQR